MIDRTLSSKISNMGFVCAMLVVALHETIGGEVGSFAWIVDRFIHDGLGRAAVPFFFMASGFFLAQHFGEPRWWVTAVRKRIKTLLIPHIFWNFLWIILPVAREVFKGLSRGTFSLPAIRMPSLAGLWGILQPPPMGTTWYITTLFGFVALAPLLVFLVRRCATTCILAVVLLHISFYNPSTDLWGQWRWLIQSVFNLEGLIFFLIGLDFALNKRNAPSRRQANYLVAIALVTTAIRLYAKAIGCQSLYLHTRLFVIPGFLVLLWRIVPAAPWPKWIVSSAFPLYLIHYLLIDCLHRAICPHLSGLLQYSCIIGLAIAISIAISIAMRRISVRFASAVFGGR